MTDKDVANDALLEKSASRKQRLPPSNECSLCHMVKLPKYSLRGDRFICDNCSGLIRFLFDEWIKEKRLA